MCILRYVPKLIHILVVVGTLSHPIFRSSNCQRVATSPIPRCGPSCAVRYPHRQARQSMSIAYHRTLQRPTSRSCDYRTLGHFTCVLTYPLTCGILDPTTITPRFTTFHPQDHHPRIVMHRCRWHNLFNLGVSPIIALLCIPTCVFTTHHCMSPVDHPVKHRHLPSHP
jgi:hypothetical protein